MKPGTKFLLGAAVIVAGVAGLIVTGVKETGVYFLTPTELLSRTRSDPGFHDVGLKVGAKVVPGSVERNQATRTIAFRVTDGTSEVIGEGKYGRDGVFHATEVLAKCGSRYEAELQKSRKA